MLLHRLRIVVLTSEGLCLTTIRPTPYFRPSLAMRSKFSGHVFLVGPADAAGLADIGALHRRRSPPGVVRHHPYLGHSKTESDRPIERQDQQRQEELSEGTSEKSMILIPELTPSFAVPDPISLIAKSCRIVGIIFGGRAIHKRVTPVVHFRFEANKEPRKFAGKRTFFRLRLPFPWATCI